MATYYVSDATGDDADNEGVAYAVTQFFDTSKLDVIGRQWFVDLSQ